jgi:hypothetical protein
MSIKNDYETTLPERLHLIEERYREAIRNVFREHGLMGAYALMETDTLFYNYSDTVRYNELGGDTYFTPLIEEEVRKLTFVQRLKGSKL